MKSPRLQKRCLTIGIKPANLSSSTNALGQELSPRHSYADGVAASILLDPGEPGEPRFIYLVPAYALSLLILSRLIDLSEKSNDDPGITFLLISLLAVMLFPVLYYGSLIERLTELVIKIVEGRRRKQVLPPDPFKSRGSLWGYNEYLYAYRSPMLGNARSRFFGISYFGVTLVILLLIRDLRDLGSVHQELWGIWLVLLAATIFVLVLAFLDVRGKGILLADFYFTYRRLIETRTIIPLKEVVEPLLRREWEQVRILLGILRRHHHLGFVQYAMEEYVRQDMTEALPVILDTLQENDVQVQSSCLEAIQRLMEQSEDKSPILLDRLLKEEPTDIGLKHKWAEILGNIGDRRCRRRLRELLLKHIRTTRSSGKGGPFVVALAKTGDIDFLGSLWRKGLIVDDCALFVMESIARFQTGKGQQLLLEYLSANQEPGILEAIGEGLEKSLEKTTPKRICEFFCRVVETHRTNEDTELARKSALVLGRIRNDEAPQWIIECLKREEREGVQIDLLDALDSQLDLVENAKVMLNSLEALENSPSYEVSYRSRVISTKLRGLREIQV